MSKVTKIIDAFYSSKIGEKLANPKATVATAAMIATVSNVSKDAVNCAYYTIQSLNNDRIPEDQRGFVAALDLSNGIMNVGVQLLMSFGIADLITSVFDNKLAKLKYFSTDEKVIKDAFESLTAEMKKKHNYEEFSKLLKQKIKQRKDLARLGFTVLTVNIAMQILTKRIITPLVATPMASYFKGKLEKAKSDNEQKTSEHKVKTVA
ncbi:hypothetical protein IKQ21_02730 [bacterium]|nr:hypothetical protein [bacterium]